MNKYIGWIMKGLAMGAANIIPGVSGGTIAFVTGIYERLINALKSFDLEAVKLLFSGKWRALAEKTDLSFLACIFLGIGIGIIGLAKVLGFAFENYEILTLAFFFGLIIASIIGVGKQISAFTILSIIGLAVGIIIAGGIAFLPPAEANSGFIYLTFCGMAAICSMILPGLSGSYILLLMGNYLLVLQAINDINIGILAPIALGCVLGMLFFSRLLSYLFKHFKDLTISLLTGFVIGSLAIIWPWKVTQYITLDNGKQKTSGYEWFLPEIGIDFFIALLLALIGFLIVWMMDRYSSNSESTEA
jgi:putative membrane protein